MCGGEIRGTGSLDTEKVWQPNGFLIASGSKIVHQLTVVFVSLSRALANFKVSLCYAE